jgi:hypothetical protein
VLSGLDHLIAEFDRAIEKCARPTDPAAK